MNYESYEDEVWAPIKGYEGLYEISTHGRVKSHHNGKKLRCTTGILKPCIHGGYYKVVLFNHNKKRKLVNVHRLVAMTFLPNPDNLPEVNHKDENKLNNHVSNLEWVSHRYNILYSDNIKKAYTKASKAVVVYDKQSNFIAEYPSAREAARQNNVHFGNVIDCCLGGRCKSVKGLIYKYKNQ